MEQDRFRQVAQELVDGAPAAFPVAVVVDHDDAAGRHLGVEVREDDAGRLVPVAVEAQQGDRAERRRIERQGVLEPAHVVAQQLGRIADLALEQAAVVVERADALLDRLEPAGAAAAGVAQGRLAIDLGPRLGQAGEAVEEMQGAGGRRAAREMSKRHQPDGAPLPDAALDEVAGDAVAVEVAHLLPQRGQALEGGHRVGRDPRHRRLDRVLLVEAEVAAERQGVERDAQRRPAAEPGQRRRQDLVVEEALELAEHGGGAASMAKKEKKQPDELSPEEIEEQNGEPLPDREAMSLLTPPGTATIAPEDGAISAPPTLPPTE